MLHTGQLQPADDVFGSMVALPGEGIPDRHPHQQDEPRPEPHLLLPSAHSLPFRAPCWSLLRGARSTWIARIGATNGRRPTVPGEGSRSIEERSGFERERKRGGSER
eukprot:scaffold649_cov347-Pavlova_lutheri.AAC.119